MPTTKLTEKSLAALAPPADVAQLAYWDTDLSGFGVVVGRAARTFVVRRWLKGRKVKVTIGRAGAVREDGHRWTVALARRRAQELLGVIASGVDPNAETRVERGAVTLRQGLELHAADMRKRNCSPRSVSTIEYEIPKYLPKWLDRPLTELTGLDLHELHESMAGTPFLANRIVAEVSAVWNTVDRLHELPGRNPASRVRRNKLPPKRERVDDGDLPAWWAKVQTLTPVRRDFQTFCLFTGMRSEAARQVRWEHLDLKVGSLHVPRPKGGEAKAFTLPISKTVIDLLKRRQKENAAEFKPYDGDAGWCFPSLSRSRVDGKFKVQPIAEPKEYRRTGDEGSKEKILPGPHTLRRTFASVASDIGIPEIDRHVLMNHSFSEKRVHDGYIKQSWDRLAACAGQIDAALWARINGKPPKKRRRE